MARSAAATARSLAQDLAAGVTVGLVSIPQALAFGLVAGVPVEHAVYTMIVPGIVASFFRDSPHLASGATNTAALMVGAALASSTLPSQYGVAAVLGTLCLIVGLAKLAAGVLGLGRLARYVSPAVVHGFTLGAAALLVIGELPHALGVEVTGRASALARLGALGRAVGDTSAAALALALVAIVTIALLRRVAPRVPGALVALIGASLACRVLGLGADQGVAFSGALPPGLPRPTLPAVYPDAILGLAPAGLALALVGMSELVSIGKSIASLTGRPLRTDRELRAQGLANLASAFFACLPSSVSWSRSAVSLESGASTSASVLFASLTVAAAALIGGSLVQHVPLAAVAGVVISIALGMIRAGAGNPLVRRDRADGAVLAVTAAATLLLPLPVAVLSRVALSLGLVIHRASLLHVAEYRMTPGGRLVERPVDAETGRSTVTVLALEGDLFFGVADELERMLDEIASRGARGIVLRVRRTHALDAAAAEALARFSVRHRARGGALAVCGLRGELAERFVESGLGAALGGDALFASDDTPFHALTRALEQVRRELAIPADAAPLRPAEDAEGEPETWSI